jgi:hypothetical protein
LLDLDFAVCELRKALIYKGSWVIPKTPKAGVAGSIPAGRAKNQRFTQLVRFFDARTALLPQRAGLPIPEPYSASQHFSIRRSRCGHA